jgi:hypothetical protein
MSRSCRRWKEFFEEEIYRGWAGQTKMFEAVEEMNAATYSSADCPVIVMVVSVLCRKLLFSASVLLSVMMICKSSAYLIPKCGCSPL